MQTRASGAEETRWYQGGGQPGSLRISKRATCLQPGAGGEILQTLEVYKAFPSEEEWSGGFEQSGATD